MKKKKLDETTYVLQNKELMRQIALSEKTHSQRTRVEESQGLEETAYLLRNTRGAKRLLDSIEELKANKGVAKELIL